MQTHTKQKYLYEKEKKNFIFALNMTKKIVFHFLLYEIYITSEI